MSFFREAVALVWVTLGCAARHPPPAATSAGQAVPGPSSSALVSKPVSAPPGLILVGRVRGYQEWLALQQMPPVVAWLERKLADEDPILAELDLKQSVEFAIVYDRTFRRTPAPPAAPVGPKESETPAADEPATDGEEEAGAQPAESEQVDDSPEQHVLAAVSLPLKRFAPATYKELGYTLAFGDTYAHGGCLIAPTPGSAPARLICAEHPDVTRALHDYLARGLPLEPLSSSPIFAEFRPGPLKPFWEPARTELNGRLKELTALGGPTARAGEEIVASLLQETDAWVASLATARFEAGPNARGEFQATARLSLQAPEPWLVQSYLAGAAAVSGPPAAFLALPKDVLSAGYSYGMPEARAALVQSAIVQLAKSALKEYGPPSKSLGSNLKAAEAQAMDHVVSELIRALDSPCFRASHSVWAGGPGGPVPVKKPIAIDAFLRSVVGYYLVATPTASHCDGLIDSLLDTLEAVHKALPAKARREFPVSLALRKAANWPGLPSATAYRITLSRQALNAWFDEGKKKLDAPAVPGKSQWTRAKSALTATLLVLPNANGAGSDWFAFGLDEKPMKAALDQVLHPLAGGTLASRPELVPFLSSKPLSLSYGTFRWQSQLIRALLGSKGEATAPISGLFDGVTFTTTSHVVRRGAGSEAVVDYYVSPEALNGVRTLLGWDVERFEQLSRQLEQAGVKDP